MKQQDPVALDELTHRLNREITAQINCLECGACCKNLMINVTQEEVKLVSDHLAISETDFREKYLEESQQEQMVINSIPCHFLAGSFCNIYENRFSGCREFPHLHKPGFQNRLFGTLMHYAMCPIVYNVVEELKTETGFNRQII